MRIFGKACVCQNILGRKSWKHPPSFSSFTLTYQDRLVPQTVIVVKPSKIVIKPSKIVLMLQRLALHLSHYASLPSAIRSPNGLLRFKSKLFYPVVCRTGGELQIPIGSCFQPNLYTCLRPTPVTEIKLIFHRITADVAAGCPPKMSRFCRFSPRFRVTYSSPR